MKECEKITYSSCRDFAVEKSTESRIIKIHKKGCEGNFVDSKFSNSGSIKSCKIYNGCKFEEKQ